MDATPSPAVGGDRQRIRPLRHVVGEIHQQWIRLNESQEIIPVLAADRSECLPITRITLPEKL